MSIIVAVIFFRLGCFIHGHLKCTEHKFEKTTLNKKLNKSMGDLAMETKRWIKRVKQCGYGVTSIYQCEWNTMIKNDPLIKEHVVNLGVDDPITSRSALYGGRTEAICLHATGDRDHPIRYIDVVSILII